LAFRLTDVDGYPEYVAARLDMFRRTAYLLCGDWYTADDLVSTALVRLLRHWRRVSTMDNPDAYVRRTLLRAWLDERRRRRPHALPRFDAVDETFGVRRKVSGGEAGLGRPRLAFRERADQVVTLGLERRGTGVRVCLRDGRHQVAHAVPAQLGGRRLPATDRRRRRRQPDVEPERVRGAKEYPSGEDLVAHKWPPPRKLVRYLERRPGRVL
jgi:Sigma-70 region 2